MDKTETTTLPAPAGSYENRGELLEIPVTLKVSQYSLASILNTAIEGGINYWCTNAWVGSKAIDKAPDECWNEYICRNVAHGGTLFIYDEKNEAWELTRDKLLKGCGRAILSGHLTEVVGYEADSFDADVIVQFALFGELVYG